ncbi:MAG: hypothetical protein ACRDNE_11460 [Gaiellaceae bacterium]
MSYYSPHTHIALARERHEDFIREASRRELARVVAGEKSLGLAARLAARLRRREAPRPAPTAS